MSAVDFSFARYTAAQCKAAGITAVGRYLTGPGKAISEVELAGFLFGGIQVWTTFEVNATDASGGSALGEQYGAEANAAWSALHQPESNPTYFAADTDYSNPEQAVPYYQGLAQARSALTNGCYGEGDLIDLLFREGLIGFGWESESTSFPGNANQSSNAAIWQKVNGAALPDTDADVLLRVDFGQLPRPAPPKPNPLPPPVVHPGDNMKATPTSVEMVGGKGWIPSPVPAASVVNVVFLTENPDVVGRYDAVPAAWSAATTAGKDSPNGALVIEGMCPDGNYGIVVQSAD